MRKTYLHDIDLRGILNGTTPLAKETNVEINKWAHIKQKPSACRNKWSKIIRHLTELEKIFTHLTKD